MAELVWWKDSIVRLAYYGKRCSCTECRVSFDSLLHYSMDTEESRVWRSTTAVWRMWCSFLGRWWVGRSLAPHSSRSHWLLTMTSIVHWTSSMLPLHSCSIVFFWAVRPILRRLVALYGWFSFTDSMSEIYTDLYIINLKFAVSLIWQETCWDYSILKYY